MFCGHLEMVVVLESKEMLVFESYSTGIERSLHCAAIPWEASRPEAHLSLYRLYSANRGNLIGFRRFGLPTTEWNLQGSKTSLIQKGFRCCFNMPTRIYRPVILVIIVRP